MIEPEYYENNENVILMQMVCMGVGMGKRESICMGGRGGDLDVKMVSLV